MTQPELLQFGEVSNEMLVSQLGLLLLALGLRGFGSKFPFLGVLFRLTQAVSQAYQGFEG